MPEMKQAAPLVKTGIKSLPEIFPFSNHPDLVSHSQLLPAGVEGVFSPAGVEGVFSPAVEGVFSGDDVGAVLAHEQLDAVVEGFDGGGAGVALLDDVQRVPRAPAQQAVLAGGLQAAVGVQAVHQAI